MTVVDSPGWRIRTSVPGESSEACSAKVCGGRFKSVSYTHLTLPTIYSV